MEFTNIDLNEEEREFLLRVCTRAKFFIENKMVPISFITDYENDIEKIEILIKKLM